jgi:putative peptidoglycan lipid II flippase
MSLARDVTTVGSATLVSRLLGFFRDVGIAAVLGTGAFADAFFAVLQLTNVFRRLLAEGALNAAFVPVWLRIKAAHGEGGADRFFQEVLVAMLLAAGALTLIGLLFAPAAVHVLAPGFDGERSALAADYLRIAAPYVVFAGVVAVVASVLNAERRVVAAALGLVAFNAVLVSAVAWIAVFVDAPMQASGATLAQAIVLAGIAQLVVTGVGFLRVRGTRIRPHFGFSAETRRFFALAAPSLIAAGIPQLKLIAGAMVASSSPAAVSWLYYANRLYELPLGVASIAVAAVLMPTIAATVRSGQPGALAAAQSRAFEIGLGLALPAATAFGLLAQPIAAGLFERGAFDARDTAAVAAALAAICAGLPGHVLEKVLGAVSFAHEDARTPMLAALAGLATALAGALVLFPRYGHVGVAAAIAISGWVGATLLGAILLARGWLGVDRAAARRLPRIMLATALMGAALVGAQTLLASMLDGASIPGRIAVLMLLVGIGLVVYLASLQVLGVARLRDLITAIRHKL